MIDSIKKVPLLSAAAAIGTALIFLRMFRTYDIMAASFLRFSLAAFMAGSLYLISGRKTFEKCFRQTEYAVTILSPILIYAILLSLARFYLYYSTNGGNLAEGWPVKLALCLILMMSVGLFEELMCRAVLCDAFIYQFRNYKGVFVLTGIAVSFIFGFLHVAGSKYYIVVVAVAAAAGCLHIIGLTGLNGSESRAASHTVNNYTGNFGDRHVAEAFLHQGNSG